MDYMAVFERWRNAAAVLDESSRQELDRMSFDVREIEERFGQELAFGTGGMRGKLGVGTGRMNRYTVRRATYGYAAYLLACVPGARESGVVIARDPRRGSTEFADETARVLASQGFVCGFSMTYADAVAVVRSAGARRGRRHSHHREPQPS